MGVHVRERLCVLHPTLREYMRKMSIKLVWFATQMGASARGAGLPLTSISWEKNEEELEREREREKACVC